MPSFLDSILTLVGFNSRLSVLEKQTKANAMKIDEAIDTIKKLKEQVNKSTAEIKAKIAKLEAADGTLTPDQEAAINELKAAVEANDAIVPDIAPEPIDPANPTE